MDEHIYSNNDAFIKNNYLLSNSTGEMKEEDSQAKEEQRDDTVSFRNVSFPISSDNSSFAENNIDNSKHRHSVNRLQANATNVSIPVAAPRQIRDAKDESVVNILESIDDTNLSTDSPQTSSPSTVNEIEEQTDNLLEEISKELFNRSGISETDLKDDEIRLFVKEFIAKYGARKNGKKSSEQNNEEALTNSECDASIETSNSDSSFNQSNKATIPVPIPRNRNSIDNTKQSSITEMQILTNSNQVVISSTVEETEEMEEDKLNQVPKEHLNTENTSERSRTMPIDLVNQNGGIERINGNSESILNHKYLTKCVETSERPIQINSRRKKLTKRDIGPPTNFVHVWGVSRIKTGTEIPIESLNHASISEILSLDGKIQPFVCDFTDENPTKENLDVIQAPVGKKVESDLERNGNLNPLKKPNKKIAPPPPTKTISNVDKPQNKAGKLTSADINLPTDFKHMFSAITEDSDNLDEISNHLIIMARISEKLLQDKEIRSRFINEYFINMNESVEKTEDSAPTARINEETNHKLKPANTLMNLTDTGESLIPAHVPNTSTSAVGSSQSVNKPQQKRSKLTAADISLPTNSKKISGASKLDATTQKVDEDIFEDESIKDFFLEAGISETQLQDKETRLFITDFMNKYRGEQRK